jgi:hypothetical protein
MAAEDLVQASLDSKVFMISSDRVGPARAGLDRDKIHSGMSLRSSRNSSREVVPEAARESRDSSKLRARILW